MSRSNHHTLRRGMDGVTVALSGVAGTLLVVLIGLIATR
jgi:hypothetical protein